MRLDNFVHWIIGIFLFLVLGGADACSSSSDSGEREGRAQQVSLRKVSVSEEPVAREPVQESSAPPDQGQEKMAATLESIPADSVQRFILTVRQEKDRHVDADNMHTVLQALEKGGAQKVEVLEDLPIIMVTGQRAAIEAAFESGLLESIQVDRLSKPYRQ